MLAASVELNRQIEMKRQLVWQPDHRLANAFVALDVELSEMANTSEWFKVWKTHRGKQDEGLTSRATLLNEYVDAMDFFLLIANLKNWNKIIVDSQSELTTITAKKAEEFLDKQYLILKQMIFKTYFAHSESSYKHAWHLFLKFGLVDFGFTTDEIQVAFFAKNEVNKQRQQNNY